MANAEKSTSNQTNGRQGAKAAGNNRAGGIDEFDLASDIKGKNSLKGMDQGSNNQRQEQAEARGDTDSLQESFEKLDKDARAELDLGKKVRSPAGKAH